MKFLLRPRRVLVLVGILAALQLLISGSLANIYNLLKSKDKIQSQLLNLDSEIGDLHRHIRLTRDPKFIENQAVDRLDLAEETDLVFVFPEI